MSIEIGSIQEGKVTGIMNFGAFVSLPGGKSGLVHISEIANTFVKDVHDHLQVGQTVKVKVLDINEQGKINYHVFKPVLFEFPTYEYFVTGDKAGDCGKMNQ